MKHKIRNNTGRIAVACGAILLQVVWLLGLVWQLNGYSVLFAVAAEALALVLAVRIYSKPQNAAVRTSWIILLMASPVLGICLYFLCGRTGANWVMRRRFQKVQGALWGKLQQDAAVTETLQNRSLAAANRAHYLQTCGYPVYQNTDVDYYATAEEAIAAQKEALRRAEHFIFMEYHAIEDSESFWEIKEILAEKARQGVEVRLFYDDMGSIGFVTPAFARHMRSLGVQCRVFNPLLPVINVFMNNRDHRKITVVDGKVGFTGGYNLADEYFNLVQPYGHWKDTGLRLRGDAVRSLTVMFLEMWNAMEQSDADADRYLPQLPYAARDGFVQPYADSPLDSERVGEFAYMNVIKTAQKRLYVMTPYLILDDEMTLELVLAAKRGVDVRIITPGIPDKKLVYGLTRSYYGALVQGGVRVYEYTPGFLHAKMMLCDDDTAVVGTVNLDYRSLYLHFENAVCLYACRAVGDVARDFEETLAQCREVTQKYRARSGPMRFGQCLLRLFAPLM